ncbi:ABC transporter permease, partial [Streptomyces lunaelactis]|nr:ABC transporter permease [Streptomyces lunaelactis]
LVLAVIVVLTLLAGWIAPHDPLAMNPMARLQGPIEGHPLGTDTFCRDIFSRVLIGGQLSLIIGIATAVVSVLLGLVIGILAGFFRTAEAIIMRAMDALMAIPSILLASALVALNGPSVGSVIAAITIPEIPRVVRLVRAVVLSAREEPYVEAAIALGTPMRKIL